MTPDLETLYHALRSGQRRALARTITLLESRRPDHQQQASALLERLLPHSGGAVRLGLSGTPGVGKSTFIEALGLHLLGLGLRVAVLAVDPSSARTGGSLLGDKTRMPRLSADSRAFVRPSPASGTLGGAARRTLEALLACEAAGFGVVIVETVGVGQSETEVADLTDLLALLTQPFAGDELQGLKRGIMERAGLIVVNKADLDPTATRKARTELEAALALLVPGDAPWRPRVLASSARSGAGIPEFWEAVLEHRTALGPLLELRRRDQRAAWFERLLREQVWQRFVLERGGEVQEALERVREGAWSPARGLEALLERGPV